MPKDLDALSITRFHDCRLSAPAWPSLPEAGVWGWIEANHRCNALLWDEEDKARRSAAPAAEIAAGKRRIDCYNQQRNDAVEALDEAILAELAPLPSADAGPRHIEACAGKLQRLELQRRDLAACFDRLLAEARQGLAYFKIYRQFKMYNDPALNPYLYGKEGP